MHSTWGRSMHKSGRGTATAQYCLGNPSKLRYELYMGCFPWRVLVTAFQFTNLSFVHVLQAVCSTCTNDRLVNANRDAVHIALLPWPLQKSLATEVLLSIQNSTE